MSVIDEAQPVDGAYRSAVLDLTSYYPTSMFHRPNNTTTTTEAERKDTHANTTKGLASVAQMNTNDTTPALQLGHAPLLQRYLPRREVKTEKANNTAEPTITTTPKTSDTSRNSRRTTTASATRSAFASPSPSLQRRRALSVPGPQQQQQHAPAIRITSIKPRQPARSVSHRAVAPVTPRTSINVDPPSAHKDTACTSPAVPSGASAQREASTEPPVTLQTTTTTTHQPSTSSSSSFCSDARCIHSRGAIAEFVAMQGELRRCYEAMAEQAAHSQALQAALDEANAALKDIKARHAATMKKVIQRAREQQYTSRTAIRHKHTRRHGRRARLTRALLDAVATHNNTNTTCTTTDVVAKQESNKEGINNVTRSAKDDEKQMTEVLLSAPGTPVCTPRCDACIETVPIETVDVGTNTSDDIERSGTTNSSSGAEQQYVSRIAALQAQVQELVRALLDKERQLASVAAERTRLRALCVNQPEHTSSKASI